MFNSHLKEENQKLLAKFSEQKCVVDGIKRSMAYIEFSLDGIIIDANELFLATVGYSLNEIVGQHHRIFCEEKYAESQDYVMFWRKLNDGEFVQGRFKRVGSNGQVIWLEATYTPIYDKDGMLCKVVKFASDITENVLRETDDHGKLQALSRSTAIIEFNPDGTIADCNDNFLGAVGYQKSDIIGKHHRIFCDRDYTESKEYAEFWRRLNRGEFFSGQFKRVNSQGEVLWLEASYNPVYDGEGNLHRIVKFASDITEQTEQGKLATENAETAYRISKETSATAEEGAKVIDKTIIEMKQMADSVDQSSQIIENLNQQSSSISSIIQTIHGIADQTNLLALNAAIEAARAGEQGRGFAVVADEVRTLAARTSESTSEISKMISDIQTSTTNATEGMETCLDQVKSGVELVHQTGEVISRIQNGATEVVSAIDSLAMNKG